MSAQFTLFDQLIPVVSISLHKLAKSLTDRRSNELDS